MSRPRSEPELPACFAVVLPGLEELAGEEIKALFKGEVKRSQPGLLVFRVPDISRSLLNLRTTEDVYVLAWGTDQLTYRAEDLKKILAWTARDVNWDRLLKIHHAIRPKPKGKPTYRLVVQMTGTHGYRRVDARKALARGLEGKLPASWRHAEENAAIEIWMIIHGATAVCGIRLSDRTMRHRTYKSEHLPASLRPTLAAAMVRLGELKPNQVILDPMCGAGTILAEVLSLAKSGPFRVRYEKVQEDEGPRTNLKVLGGDWEREAVRSATSNLRHLGEPWLARWDARQLPLPEASVDRILCNLPFGKQIGEEEDIGPLYQETLPEFDRVLKPGGKAVLLVANAQLIRQATRELSWKLVRSIQVRILGQRATAMVFKKEAN